MEVVVIAEVLSCIVGRGDVDHLDRVVVAALRKLQHFEIVAFDIDVLRRLPIAGTGAVGNERPVRTLERELPCRLLAVSGHAVAPRTSRDVFAEKRPQGR